jgi:hypothetical protein
MRYPPALAVPTTPTSHDPPAETPTSSVNKVSFVKSYVLTLASDCEPPVIRSRPEATLALDDNFHREPANVVKLSERLETFASG